MYASDLAQTLYELMTKSDASHGDWTEFNERMESLRNYGRLPRGRAHHATLLTDEQIADAVLGLSTPKPGWTGHVATILRSLKPVGGVDASFEGAETLNNALQILLSSKAARDRLLLLSITSAECGTNADGHASLRYKDGTEKTAYFVHQLAISLHGKGAEKTYQPRDYSAPAARQLTLGKRFFERLAERAEIARRLRPGPSSDGSEYDASEAEDRRRKALGVANSSRYLNVAVDNQVTWPNKEKLIKFDRYTMVLLPKTKDNVQSISMDLTANRLSSREAITVLNRFLSVLCFCDDQYAVRQEGWSGNPIPVAVSRRNLAFTTTSTWVFSRNIPEKEEARRALALYREARNAEENYLVSYAVLNYYKIVEILYPEGKDTRAWLAKVFPLVKNAFGAEVLERFDKERGSVEPEAHIYKAYRIAVAHASDKQLSDPDASEELTRLHTAADILRPMARYFIKKELGVSDSQYTDTVAGDEPMV